MADKATDTNDAQAPVDKKELEKAKKVIANLLDLLGADGKRTATAGVEGIDVVLETKDTGVVIGYHGEVLEALQLVFSLCVSKQIGRFVRISLEVGDYKKNRTGWLENLAVQAKEQALAEGKEVSIPNLKSWERRIVHLCLQDDQAVMSESIGEGKERTLVVKPRT